MGDHHRPAGDAINSAAASTRGAGSASALKSWGRQGPRSVGHCTAASGCVAQGRAGWGRGATPRMAAAGMLVFGEEWILENYCQQADLVVLLTMAIRVMQRVPGC